MFKILAINIFVFATMHEERSGAECVLEQELLYFQCGVSLVFGVFQSGREFLRYLTSKYWESLAYSDLPFSCR